MKNQTHVRYLQGVKFFNGLVEIKAGEVVRITKSLGKNAAWVIRDNGDTWAEIGINGVRAEYCNPEADKSLSTMKPHYIHISCFNGGEIHIGPFDSFKSADDHLENWPDGWQWDAVIDSNSPVGTCFPVSAPHAEIIKEIEGDYLTSGDV